MRTVTTLNYTSNMIRTGMKYTKEDSIMTKGVAILAMVCLHLFYREGPTVLGKPVLWFSEDVPMVSWIGFFSEYCVTLYSICAGYGYYYMYKLGNGSLRNRIKRVIKLLLTYWTILILFCFIGLIWNPHGTVPGSIKQFLQNAVLYKSYCGSWWYLHTYVFLMFLPSSIVVVLAEHSDIRKGLLICLCAQIGWYMVTKFRIIPFVQGSGIVNYVYTECKNLISIIPAVWAGTLLCRDNTISDLDSLLCKRFSIKIRNAAIVISWIMWFLLFNLLHKSVLVGLLGLWVFVTFNLLRKPKVIEKALLFLGKHSTNIWLTHMFFYTRLFDGLVAKAQLPLLMLLFMLGLCILSSITINMIVNRIVFINIIVLKKCKPNP